MKQKKVALVTGGTGGMGELICERLFKDGYIVVANYKRFTGHQKPQVSAEQWRKNKLKSGIDINIAEGDVTNYNSISKMVQKIQKNIGPINILINNAGISMDAPLRKMNLEQWNNVISTNLTSVFICTQLVINSMIECGWGRVINIASINGHKGSFGASNYSAAKSGMYGFTKSVALEVVKKGITVNTISPGYCDTPLLKNIPSEILKKIVAEIPIGRLGKPSEIAAAVSYLCSEEAAFITGTDISITGGQYM